MSFPIDNIQAACKERRITIAELERNCGIGNGVIKGWEKAKGTPQLHQLVAIAEHLNVPFNRIAFGEDEKTAPVEDGLSDLQRALIKSAATWSDRTIVLAMQIANELEASRNHRDDS